MKFAYGSDLHLEFGNLKEIESDANVLLLAGDICIAADMFPMEDTINFKDSHILKGAGHNFNLFFDSVSAQYDQIFMIPGNHEHYHGNFEYTVQKLRDHVPANVTILDNEFVDVGDVRIIGCTLWTDCNQDDWATKNAIRNGMNDYHVIKKGTKSLLPDDTMLEHYRSVDFIRQNMTDRTIVMTHHAPSFMSVNEKYHHMSISNGGYASNLDRFVDETSPLIWIHGHMHDPVDYLIGRTRVVSNPRGYVGHEIDHGQYNFATVEV